MTMPLVPQLLTVIQQIIRHELAQMRSCQLGVVTANYPHTAETDDNNYEVNVRLKYEGLELQRVPVSAGAMGAVAVPQVGDLVLVQFVDGDLNQPLITGRFYHADQRPPIHAAEDILFEQYVAADNTLNRLHLMPDGAILIQRGVSDHSESKAEIKIDSDGKIIIRAEEVTIQGKLIVTDESTLQAKLVVQTGSKATIITGGQIEGQA